MATETLTHQNGVVPNGDHGTSSATVKKSRESERRRRRRKQKKINKASKEPKSNASEDDNDTKPEPQQVLIFLLNFWQILVWLGSIYNQVVEQIEIEYVPEKAELYEGLDEEFKKIFEKFSFSEVTGSEDNDKKDELAENSITKKKADSDSEEEEENDNEQKEKGVSNKKKKLQRRMKIAELKQISSRPDVVEVWDATSADPKLLVFLKSYRNTVPVPRHWGAVVAITNPGIGKRGIEKQPFQLPDFIAATGIEKIRQSYIEKEDSKKLKQKQRERMQPKMGKMDIDYQVLHDAFFKYQTKPKLSSLGELYHEGKEFEVKLREMKPGMLSHELKEALGMPEGSPPPWLINMQRYGPPPSYPHLKIPGLNAPIPPGASFGYHPGGWGKPPVDEFGRPLYGDVFGVHQQDQPNYEVGLHKSFTLQLEGSIFTAGTEKVPKACFDGTDVPPHVGWRSCCQRLLGCCLISVMTTIVVNLALMLPELLCCRDEGKDQE
ncbi:splicing factor 3B subunit 2-like protein [Trifolium pratense]|uniref:Splicing factor 3B subunit 2-like protein n=1 Tax=Trifolium pratense TaxID=57577 RepID=A0A2K3PAX4_TRIPR|nr:splicing factor 3B subunit 2-like protein [Trifolium pratense]